MLSYWEKSQFTAYDYVIVGAGIVGLSTAISLRHRNPKASILVLERGLLPTGASTRNAGFACFGSLSELLEDIDTLGEEGMVSLVRLRYEGLGLLRERLGDQRIDYHEYGGYELLREEEMPILQKLDRVNDLLKEIFDRQVFTEAGHRLPGTGFDTRHIRGLIYNPYEGQLDTGLLMRSLWELALERGIKVLTGSEVEHYETTPKGVTLRLRNAAREDVLKLRGRKVAFCTNAFTRKLFPEVALYPGRGMVMVTNEIPGLPFKGTFHMEKGYYYFRNLGQRVLIGGGRNLQMEEETTLEFGINEVIRERLLGILQNDILPGGYYKIEHTWSGIMAFGKNKAPFVREHRENVFLGVRLGGMGVAIGSKVGEQLAEMMSGDDHM